MAEREPGSDLLPIARDPAAFEAFYRRHVTDVTRFVARRTADPHTVADLTAEVFLAVIGSAHTYSASRGTQRAWLNGIAATSSPGSAAVPLSSCGPSPRSRRPQPPATDDIARLGGPGRRAEAERRRLYLALAGLPPDEARCLSLSASTGCRWAGRPPPRSASCRAPHGCDCTAPAVPRGMPSASPPFATHRIRPWRARHEDFSSPFPEETRRGCPPRAGGQVPRHVRGESASRAQARAGRARHGVSADRATAR